MAARHKKSLIDYDSLAKMDQETESQVLDTVVMALEVVQQQNPEGADNLSESVNHDEFSEAYTSEMDMENVLADFPEDSISDEATIEDLAEPVIILDATLTIQNVVKLYEKIKKSYSANDAIEINAAQVSSIDTATLQLLVALKNDAIKQQKEVVIAAPSPRFIESAGLLGLLEVLEIDA